MIFGQSLGAIADPAAALVQAKTLRAQATLKRVAGDISAATALETVAAGLEKAAAETTAGAILPPPAPPPAPGIKTAAILPLPSVSFFEEYSLPIKIGAGVALAGIVGYFVLRRRGR